MKSKTKEIFLFIFIIFMIICFIVSELTREYMLDNTIGGLVNLLSYIFMFIFLFLLLIFLLLNSSHIEDTNKKEDKKSFNNEIIESSEIEKNLYNPSKKKRFL